MRMSDWSSDVCSSDLFARALDFISSTSAAGGKVLFVGTKRQAQGLIADAARASGQHFVNHRWLGGMLTNWKTISGSIKRLKTLEEQLSGDTSRSEEHTSELQSLMRISYAVFCLKKKKKHYKQTNTTTHHHPH